MLLETESFCFLVFTTLLGAGWSEGAQPLRHQGFVRPSRAYVHIPHPEQPLHGDPSGSRTKAIAEVREAFQRAAPRVQLYFDVTKEERGSEGSSGLISTQRSVKKAPPPHPRHGRGWQSPQLKPQPHGGQ